MGFGKMIVVFLIITLASYLFCYGVSGSPMQFVSDLATSGGTTVDATFQFCIVFGLVVTVILAVFDRGD